MQHGEVLSPEPGHFTAQSPHQGAALHPQYRAATLRQIRAGPFPGNSEPHFPIDLAPNAIPSDEKL